MLGDFSSRVDLNEKIMRIKNWNCDRAELEIYFGPQIPVTTRIRPYDLEDQVTTWNARDLQFKPCDHWDL